MKPDLISKELLISTWWSMQFIILYEFRNIDENGLKWMLYDIAGKNTILLTQSDFGLETRIKLQIRTVSVFQKFSLFCFIEISIEILNGWEYSEW